MKGKRIVKSIGALAVALVMAANFALAGLPAAGKAGAQVAPPNSEAYGKSLTDWLSIYWRWYYSGSDMTQSKIGPMQLMPLPAGTYISGAGSPDDPALYVGQVEITIPAGTPFVLPEFAWAGERYEGYPAVPDDKPIPDDVLLANVHPDLTIDGKTIISDANKGAFYVPTTYFDPIVTYPAPTSYGSVAAVFFQGDGFLCLPLTPGVHVIHLYEPFVIPASVYPPPWTGFGVIYDNTWIVTVR